MRAAWTGWAPGPRLSMNDSVPANRWARMKRREAEQAWKQAAWAAVRSAPVPSVSGVATLTVEFGTDRPNQRRDPHNVMPTVKYLIDGIVRAGALVDDSARYLRTTEPIFTSDIKPGMFRLTLEWED